MLKSTTSKEGAAFGLVDTIPTPVLVLSDSQIILQANPTFVEEFCPRQKQVIGLHLEALGIQFFTENREPVALKELCKAAEEGTSKGSVETVGVDTGKTSEARGTAWFRVTASGMAADNQGTIHKLLLLLM